MLTESQFFYLRLLTTYEENYLCQLLKYNQIFLKIGVSGRLNVNGALGKHLVGRHVQIEQASFNK